MNLFATPSALERVVMSAARQDAINELSSHGIAVTQQRYAREFRSRAYDIIRDKPLIETTSEDLKTVLKRGTYSTNHALRRLHNLALGNGWIHWHIIPPKQWPKSPTKPKRSITQEEHNKIIAAEMNEERRYYYEMLWLELPPKGWTGAEVLWV